MSIDLVFVLGYPDHYLRFDFAPAGEQGFDASYPNFPKNADAWMVKVLQLGAFESNQRTSAAAKLSTHLNIGRSDDSYPGENPT
ncbi:MAG: hypothetical protein AAGJ40_07470 [Planctomycetota bacterium]